MKLGIVVVYLFDENTEYLFDLHINYIRKFTISPYVIYGSVGRLNSKWRQKLSNYSEIQQCEITPTELRKAAEHAYYLERLTEIAFLDGATHVVTLHLDSFPVCKGWEMVLGAITAQSGTCIAVDEVYTACLFFTKDFYFRYRPTFNFVNEPPEFLEFIKRYQLINHSGTPYLYACYINYLDWHILKKISDNQLLRFGYFYGGLIFHFEGGVRFSPGIGGSQEKLPSKIQSILPIFFQLLRKISFFRAIWSCLCKILPTKMSCLLKGWMSDQVLLGEVVKNSFCKAKLMKRSQFCLSDIGILSEKTKDAIHLCSRKA